MSNCMQLFDFKGLMRFQSGNASLLVEQHVCMCLHWLYFSFKCQALCDISLCRCFLLKCFIVLVQISYLTCILVNNFQQETVVMAVWDWSIVQTLIKEHWSCACMHNGELPPTGVSLPMRQKLSAECWDTMWIQILQVIVRSITMDIYSLT